MVEQNQSRGSPFCQAAMLMAQKNYLHWWLAGTTNSTAKVIYKTSSPNTQKIPIHGWLQAIQGVSCATGLPDTGKKQKNLAAHPWDSNALKNIKVPPPPPKWTRHLQSVAMGIIHAFQCQYRKQLVWKAATIDIELLGDLWGWRKSGRRAY